MIVEEYVGKMFFSGICGYGCLDYVSVCFNGFCKWFLRELIIERFVVDILI